MTKRLSILLGALYTLMGVAGFLDTPLVGTRGFFVANPPYAFALVFFGIILGAGMYIADTAVTLAVIVGVALALVGFVTLCLAPRNSLTFGMLMNSPDYWLNLISGALLIVVGEQELLQHGHGAPDRHVH